MEVWRRVDVLIVIDLYLSVELPTAELAVRVAEAMMGMFSPPL